MRTTVKELIGSITGRDGKVWDIYFHGKYRHMTAECEGRIEEIDGLPEDIAEAKEYIDKHWDKKEWKRKVCPVVIDLSEEEKKKLLEEKAFEYLNVIGIEIAEERREDVITRGELFLILARIFNNSNFHVFDENRLLEIACDRDEDQ